MADRKQDHEDGIEFSFVKIIDGILGAEGPVFDKKDQFYMVAPGVLRADKHAGQVLKIDLKNKRASLLCEPSVDGYGGIPAGCQCDHNNNLWIADMRLGVLKVSPDGKYEQEAFGSVYCINKEGEVLKIDSGLKFPNGIAVKHTPDGHPSLLIVAETPTKTLWAYTISGPAKVGPRRAWGKLTGDLEGGPDGMDFDEDNNLLVAHWGSSCLEVFGPDGGNPHTKIKCPFSKPSNLHFQPGSNTVYVAEHENMGLWKFEWRRPGKRQYCETCRF